MNKNMSKKTWTQIPYFKVFSDKFKIEKDINLLINGLSVYSLLNEEIKSKIDYIVSYENNEVYICPIKPVDEYDQFLLYGNRFVFAKVIMNTADTWQVH